jgi:hypothetical protein
MRKLVFVAAVALAGCAASSQWSKSGATPQNLVDDQALCHTKAEAIFPVDPKMMSAGWSTAPRRECSGPSNSNCVNVPGVLAPERMLDANEASRKKGEDACMKALGWSR